MTRKVIGKIAAFIGFSLLLIGAPAQAHVWLDECKIQFDNEFALTWVHVNARATFAVHTGLNGSGQTEACNASHLACWTYRERCGIRGYVNVEEAPVGTYNHFHLMFEDAALSAGPCFVDPDGRGAGYGRPSGSGCTAADWKHEPRFAAGHTSDHFMKVWIEDRVTHDPRIFDIASIRVRGPAAAEIWFQKSDNSWWYWPSLAANRWNLSAYTVDIKALYVKAAAGSGTSVSFDDVVVRN
jgi:hypothetical protein